MLIVASETILNSYYIIGQELCQAEYDIVTLK